MKTQFLALLSCVCVSACLDPVPENFDAGVDAGQQLASTDGGAMDLGLADSGVTDAGFTDAGEVDAGVLDAGLPDASVPDAGLPDAGLPDAGVPDASVPDAGVPDAGDVDAGVADSGVPDSGHLGGPDAGVPDAGPPPCSTLDPCVASDYRFEESPDCGTYCYYDELHNIAVNGPGQGNNPAGFSLYATGQLLDGVRGDPNYLAAMGYHWVGWLYRDAHVVFRFPTARQFNSVRIGLNNHATGGINSPSEVHVQFSDDGVTFGRAFEFRRASGTLPIITPGTRDDVLLYTPGGAGRFIRLTLIYSAAWTMIDELEFY